MNDALGQTVLQLLPTDRRRESVIAMAAGSGQMARYAVQAGADLLLVLNATMTWRGIRPLVHVLDGIYETGVRLTKSAFRPIATRQVRSPTLPKWSVIIQPNTG